MKNIVIASLAALAILGCADGKQATQSTGRMLGANSKVGGGTVSSFAEFAKEGAPKAIGIVFQAGALDGLPAAPSDGHHCFDRDKDGKIDLAKECFSTHEWVIPLPSEAARRSDIPFKWVGLNWNPHGHIPPGVYDLPHFDVHFYIEPIEKIFAIGSGPCGPEFVNCDQFKIATRPLPANYMHSDYRNVDAVAPAMGNHLIDPTGPEFNKKKFTRTFIFGGYDGRLTFYEEMVTREYMMSQPDACFAIKSPPAVAAKGYYPTQSCIRFLPQSKEYTVSLEGFALREASAPLVAKAAQ
ncbi:MAG TPA: hypothetical protein VLC73_17935 [Burkholderiales bacterium]|nr:hypothetical protein [Burkholderiales bacterium]